MFERFRLECGEKGMVVEIASNEGYLLQYFVKPGIPVLVLRMRRKVARWRLAVERGVPRTGC